MSENRGYQQDSLIEVTALTLICRGESIEIHSGNAGLKSEVRHSAHSLINIKPGIDEMRHINGLIQRLFTPDIAECAALFSDLYRHTDRY